jgi:hypothetical protein
VIRAVAEALGIPPDKLLARAGMLHHPPDATDTEDGRSGRTESHDVEAAIRAEDRLTEEQKRALISVFRSYLAT